MSLRQTTSYEIPSRLSPRAPGPAGRRTLLALAALTAACAGCDTRPGAVDPFGPIITVAAAGGTRPTVAVDPCDGTVYVAWIGGGEGGTDLFLSRIDPGAEAPNPPVRVNHIPGDAAPHDQAPPRVVVGPEGNVYVAWQNNTEIPGRRFPASNLRFARSTDRGTNFEPAIFVNDDAEAGPPASHTFHDMAVAADGTIVVSWIDSRTRATQQPGTKASADAQHHGQEHHEIGPEIRVATSSDRGRSFGPSQIVDTNACPCCRTAIVLGEDGAAYIAWRKVFPGGIRDIVVARVDVRAPTHVAHDPVRPHHDDWRFDACPHAGPALFVAEDSVVHVAWYTGQPGRAGLYLAASNDGGATFGAALPILTAEALPPSQVALAPISDGALLVAWEDRRHPERTIRTALLRDGRLDEIATTLHGATPDLTHANGTTALAWLDGDAVKVRIAR